MSTDVVVLGYTTVEHSLVVSQPLAPERTAIVTERSTGATGRIGGCAAYIATGLAGRGRSVSLASRVGADEAGARLVDSLASAGVVTDAVERRGRTPAVWMVYGPDGATWCIYDPADGVHDALTPAQRAALESARWCVVAIGPYDATLAALDVLSADQRLLWSVKADGASCPPELVGRLARRADVIMLSERERDWVEAQLDADLFDVAKAECLVVETSGARGLRWRQGGRTGAAGPDHVFDVADTSGAGDWAVAGLLAALCAGADTDDAVRAAVETAAELLQKRTDRESTS